MVKYNDSHLDLIFHALADPTRRAMLLQLSRKELCVTELAAPFDMSLAAVSKHLKVLEAAQFIRRTKDGRTYRCAVNLSPLEDVTKLLEKLGSFWRKRLDALDEFLIKETTEKE